MDLGVKEMNLAYKMFKEIVILVSEVVLRMSIGFMKNI